VGMCCIACSRANVHGRSRIIACSPATVRSRVRVHVCVCVELRFTFHAFFSRLLLRILDLRTLTGVKVEVVIDALVCTCKLCHAV